MPVRASIARRARARERAREDILLASAGVFARRGYASATLADLAEAAGYAAPSLYRYFASKEEIFRSLVDLLVAEFSATFDAPVDRALPLPTRLEALLRCQYELARRRREIFGVLLADRGSDAPWPAAGRPIHDPGAGLEFYQQRLRAWLRRNAAPGELRFPATLSARAIAGTVFAFHPSRLARDLDPGERARTVADLALHGVTP